MQCEAGATQLPLQLVVFHQEPQDWRGCANCLITHKKEKKKMEANPATQQEAIRVPSPGAGWEESPVLAASNVIP